jgi:hypothetical protein
VITSGKREISEESVRLISGSRMPFGPLRNGEPKAISNTVRYAKHGSRSHGTVICVYDADGNVIGAHVQNRLQACSLVATAGV